MTFVKNTDHLVYWISDTDCILLSQQEDSTVIILTVTCLLFPCNSREHIALGKNYPLEVISIAWTEITSLAERNEFSNRNNSTQSLIFTDT